MRPTTQRRPAALLALALLTGFSVALWAFTGGIGPAARAQSSLDPAAPATAAPAPSAEDEALARSIIDELVRRRPLNEGHLRFEGDVEVAAPWGRSAFTAYVEKRGGQARVITRGAPWYVPGEFTVLLGDLGELLSGFDLRYEGITEQNGRRLLVVSGKHRRPGLTEARFGRVTVDLGLREAVRVELVYFWGSITSELEYGNVAGHRVVLRQTTRVDPPGLRLTTRYHRFEWPDEAPPGDVG